MNKKFDCVEMKQKGADRCRQETERLSQEEELKYWQMQTRKLRKQKKEIIKKQTEEP